jgi:hypothetical protein
MNTKLKNFILPVMLVIALMIPVTVALNSTTYMTRYNPFTKAYDYVLNWKNMTIENLTVSYVSGDGSGLTSLNHSNLANATMPSACSASFGVSEINPGSTVCTHFMLGTGDTVTGDYNVNGTITVVNANVTGTTTTADLSVTANTTAMTCNATNAGSIYYNGGTKKHYGCNSTDWNALY